MYRENLDVLTLRVIQMARRVSNVTGQLTAPQERGGRIFFWLDWVKANFPAAFVSRLNDDELDIICHNLIHFDVLGYKQSLDLGGHAFTLGVDPTNFDVDLFRGSAERGIKSYSKWVSSEPLPGLQQSLLIGHLSFFSGEDGDTPASPAPALSDDHKAAAAAMMPGIELADVQAVLAKANAEFVTSLNPERLMRAMACYMKARSTMHVQYHMGNQESDGTRILTFAWKNTPKVWFPLKMALLFRRYGLAMANSQWTVIDSYDPRNAVLVTSCRLTALDTSTPLDTARFLREFCVLKFFRMMDPIATSLVVPGLITGEQAHFLRASINFVHQVLVDLDPYRYTFESVREAMCYHPELTAAVVRAFDLKFNPQAVDKAKSDETLAAAERDIKALDTGHPYNDERRRNVLLQCVNFVRHTLKTNTYASHKLALAFRLDPCYLNYGLYTKGQRHTKYPELPYGVFFIKGRHFFGFQVRFRELARGGMRTLIIRSEEQAQAERQNIFTECYNLAYTQQKKNKDIPEGGAKAMIFMGSHFEAPSELELFKAERRQAGLTPEAVAAEAKEFASKSALEYLYDTQKAFVDGLLSVINCDAETGKLKNPRVIDYHGRPEWIYIGPDENCHDAMIAWMGEESKRVGYKIGGALISGKTPIGFNHKEFGVTSLGVKVYLEHVLRFLGIDPEKQQFTIKISGGPDGDVAGNMINYLYEYWPKTAILQVITDGSGTAYDPKGFDLATLRSMFDRVEAIAKYPAAKLNEGGWILSRGTTRSERSFTQETLIMRKRDGKVVEDWVATSMANALFRTNAHKTKTDVFVPGGGRPRTLNPDNWTEFLDEDGVPTSRAIVEGANLYLTAEARKKLEAKGVLIVKDSSANKCGVITSSYEILSSLCLTDEQFLSNKAKLIAEVKDILIQRAASEAQLLLSEHKRTGTSVTTLSDAVSAKINSFTDELYAYFDRVSLSTAEDDPLTQIYLDYAPPTLSSTFRSQLVREVPETHRKAVIAAALAAKLVYSKGLHWSPTLVDMLPLLLKDQAFFA